MGRFRVFGEQATQANIVIENGRFDEHPGVACGIAETGEIRLSASATVDDRRVHRIGRRRERFGDDIRLETDIARDSRPGDVLLPDSGHDKGLGRHGYFGLAEFLLCPGDGFVIRARAGYASANLVRQFMKIVDDRCVAQYRGNKAVNVIGLGRSCGAQNDDAEQGM